MPRPSIFAKPTPIARTWDLVRPNGGYAIGCPRLIASIGHRIASQTNDTVISP